MQVIYRATHLPTNKHYVGYKADITKLSSYKTSSKTVKAMMTKNPEEWAMEPIVFILPGVNPVEAVRLEQEVIKQYFDDLGGWDGLWNKAFGYGQENAYSPEAMKKAKETHQSPEFRQLRGRISKAQNSDPEYIKILSQSQTTRHANNPEIGKAHSRVMKEICAKPEFREDMSRVKKEFYVNNPQALVDLSKRGQEYWDNNIEAKEAMSRIKKEYHVNNPQAKDAFGKRQKEHFAKPGAKEAERQRQIEWYANNPKAIEAARQKTIEQFSKPGAREAMRQAKLKASGKTIEVTFLDGEVLTHFGVRPLETKLGARHLGEMANGTFSRSKDGSFNKITCKSPEYAGRKIVSARFI